MQLSGLLLAHYDEERDRIRCPILGPALRHVLAQEGSIERLLLIVTEQAPAHPNDTLTAGRSVARRLRDEFGPLIAAIDPAAIVVRENPHAHDRMYTAIGAALFRLLPPSPDARFYALVSGGTPAITDSLRQQSMRIYRGGCTVLHTDEPAPGQMEGSVREVVLDPYTWDMALRSAEELVKEYDYAGALRTLRDFDTKWR